MPTVPEVEYFMMGGQYPCGSLGNFQVAFYKRDNTYVSFWHTKEVEYPIVVIHDTDNLVDAVHIKPFGGKVFFFASKEAAENSAYPDPCDVLATYINTTI